MRHCEGVSKNNIIQKVKPTYKKMQIKELCSHICETANDNTRFFYFGGGVLGI